MVHRNIINQVNEFNVKICRAVQGRPEIYDRHHKGYKNSSVRQIAWLAVARECNASVNSCKKRWRAIRYEFSRIYNDTPINHVENFYLKDHLKFLIPQVPNAEKFQKEFEQTKNDNNDNGDDDDVNEDDNVAKTDNEDDNVDKTDNEDDNVDKTDNEQISNANDSSDQTHQDKESDFESCDETTIFSVKQNPKKTGIIIIKTTASSAQKKDTVNTAEASGNAENSTEKKRGRPKGSRRLSTRLTSLTHEISQSPLSKSEKRITRASRRLATHIGASTSAAAANYIRESGVRMTPLPKVKKTKSQMQIEDNGEHMKIEKKSSEENEQKNSNSNEQENNNKEPIRKAKSVEKDGEDESPVEKIQKSFSQEKIATLFTTPKTSKIQQRRSTNISLSSSSRPVDYHSDVSNQSQLHDTAQEEPKDRASTHSLVSKSSSGDNTSEDKDEQNASNSLSSKSSSIDTRKEKQDDQSCTAPISKPPEGKVDDSSQTDEHADNYDDLFLNGIRAHLQAMNKRQKLKFRIGVFEVLIQVKEDATDFPGQETQHFDASAPSIMDGLTDKQLALMKELISTVTEGNNTPQTSNKGNHLYYRNNKSDQSNDHDDDDSDSLESLPFSVEPSSSCENQIASATLTLTETLSPDKTDSSVEPLPQFITPPEFVVPAEFVSPTESILPVEKLTPFVKIRKSFDEEGSQHNIVRGILKFPEQSAENSPQKRVFRILSRADSTNVNSFNQRVPLSRTYTESGTTTRPISYRSLQKTAPNSNYTMTLSPSASTSVANAALNNTNSLLQSSQKRLSKPANRQNSGTADNAVPFRRFSVCGPAHRGSPLLAKTNQPNTGIDPVTLRRIPAATHSLLKINSNADVSSANRNGASRNTQQVPNKRRLGPITSSAVAAQRPRLMPVSTVTAARPVPTATAVAPAIALPRLKILPRSARLKSGYVPPLTPPQNQERRYTITGGGGGYSRGIGASVGNSGTSAGSANIGNRRGAGGGAMQHLYDQKRTNGASTSKGCARSNMRQYTRTQSTVNMKSPTLLRPPIKLAKEQTPKRTANEGGKHQMSKLSKFLSNDGEEFMQTAATIAADDFSFPVKQEPEDILGM